MHHAAQRCSTGLRSPRWPTPFNETPLGLGQGDHRHGANNERQAI